MLPLVSIMIATYNSSHIIPKTLDAIKMQNYPQDKLDILIIDGGSTDETRIIAQKYGCRIFDNPKTEPINAKFIGLREAKGDYLITIDHDEVMINQSSIINKVNAIKSNTECKVVMCSGYKRPNNYPLLNEYISEFGDPFSLFMYNFTKGYGLMEKNYKRHFPIINETSEYYVVDFEAMKKECIIELVCLGTMIDRNFFIEHTDILINANTLINLFYIMLNMNRYKVIVLKNDPLEHYSADSLKKYWPKLKWRICNNIHFPEKGAVGFSGRAKYQGKWVKWKRILYLPYSFIIILPFIQGIYLSATRKNAIYLLHPIFCLYVAGQIVYQYMLKIIGITPSFMSYDGKSIIER